MTENTVASVLVIKIWSLKFIWDLEFIYCCFIL